MQTGSCMLCIGIDSIRRREILSRKLCNSETEVESESLLGNIKIRGLKFMEIAIPKDIRTSRLP